MLKFNLQCEALRSWNLNLTMMSRGGPFVKWLEFHKVIRVEPLWLNPGGTVRGTHHTDTQLHPMSLVIWGPVLPQDSAREKTITRAQTSEAHPILDSEPLESWAKINLLSSSNSLLQVFCCSNEKLINTLSFPLLTCLAVYHHIMSISHINCLVPSVSLLLF